MKLIFFGVFTAVAERKIVERQYSPSSFYLRNFSLGIVTVPHLITKRFLGNSIGKTSRAIKISRKLGLILLKKISVYNTSMIVERKSRAFFSVFAFIIMISIVVAYYRYVVIRDFDFFTDEETFYETLLEE